MGSLTGAFVAALTDMDTTAQEALGTIRFNEDKIFKYVKFTGTTTVAAGDVVCYTTATDGYTVDGANTNLGAGVVQAAGASGTVRYGWIQIGGQATLSTALAGSPAVGDDMTTNGASAPAVTLRNADAEQKVANVVHVSNKIVKCSFPF